MILKQWLNINLQRSRATVVTRTLVPAMIEEAKEMDSVSLAFSAFSLHLSLFFLAFSSHSFCFFAFFFLLTLKSSLHLLNLYLESFFEHSTLQDFIAFSKAFLQEIPCFSETPSFLAFLFLSSFALALAAALARAFFSLSALA